MVGFRPRAWQFCGLGLGGYGGRNERERELEKSTVRHRKIVEGWEKTMLNDQVTRLHTSLTPVLCNFESYFRDRVFVGGSPFSLPFTVDLGDT